MTAGAEVSSDPRTRILDAALSLMSEQGSAGASMRQLATACGLNVATIYHYFPSKADLLLSVMDERRYGERLGTDTPPLDPALDPRARLVQLVSWLWENALVEEPVLRLLVGEAIRGEAAASVSLGEVVAALEATLAVWLGQGFPELRGDPGAVSRVITGQVFTLAVTHLALGGITPEAARTRATELATVVFP